MDACYHRRIQRGAIMATTCTVYLLATLAAALNMHGTARVNVLLVLAVLAAVAAGVLA